MKFVFYTHSLISDWNHGNAHFLRGIMRELVNAGHEAIALEPAGAWSRQNLVSDQGLQAVERFFADFPGLQSTIYDDEFDHEAALDGADVVVVHEWTEPQIVRLIGEIRRRNDFTLLFHDTHHRAVSAEPEIAELSLQDYDIVLAFGETLRQRYLDAGWGSQVVTWHEAADLRLFRPMHTSIKDGDLIWIGNWGDDERTAELHEYLIDPVRELSLVATVRGVRYPDEAQEALRTANISYGGWIANADVPEAFARYRVTVHVPRRPYRETLPGIPTIRMFEALACGIPLVSAPWEDAEGLFRAGRDFLFARDGSEMKAHLANILSDPELSAELARNGYETIRDRHSCAHRVDELLQVLSKHGTSRVRTQLAPKEAAE